MVLSSFRRLALGIDAADGELTEEGFDHRSPIVLGVCHVEECIDPRDPKGFVTWAGWWTDEAAGGRGRAWCWFR
jgi:hypothetical protein